MTPAPAADPLSALIARTTAALDLAGPQSAPFWRFARCWMLETRFEDFGGAVSDLDQALADFDALPHGTPGRERLAAVLATAHVRASLLTDPARFARVRSLTAVANGDPDPLAAWQSIAAVVRSFELMYGAMNGDPGFTLLAAQAELTRLAAAVGTEEPQATQVELARFAIDAHGLLLHRGAGDGEELAGRMANLVDRFRAHGVNNAQLEYLLAIVEAHKALVSYDVTKLADLLDTFRGVRDRLPVGSIYRKQFDDMLTQIEPMLRAFMPGGPTDPAIWAPGMPAATASPAPRAAARPYVAEAASPQEAATHWATAGVQQLMAAHDSPEGIDLAIDYLTRSVTVSPEHDPRRPAYLMNLGVALLGRYELCSNANDLADATQRLEEARALSGIDMHWVWTMCANPLAQAYRLAGRRDLGRQTALSGLRGHAWNALMQMRTTDISRTHGDTASDALDVARWCLSDGDAAGAAAALDASRALTLYAAVGRRGIVTQLRALSENDLADDWEKARATDGAEHVPVGLRQRVIAALSGVSGPIAAATVPPRPGLDRATRQLLDPPDLHQVRAALGALNLDALVYLMPGDEGPGAAVVVARHDNVSYALLPKLTNAEIERVDRSLATVSWDLVRGGSDGEGASAARSERDLIVRVRRSVDDVCEWAWHAAIAPLIERHINMPTDRPLRLVLIPMRELSRVPWHAAHRTVNGTKEYALRRVRFSYTPSARILCDTAWRAPVPTGDDPVRALVVADPDTGGRAPDLPAARTEAQAIRQAFYPSAKYFGRAIDDSLSPDRAGTVQDLMTWLADPGGGSVVHLAVHGEARSGRDSTETSFLLLAGEPGRLAAESLVDVLAQHPGSVDRAIDLAVLAGCRTGEATRGFDEAFSIGTALLANGVRTVISSQWSVPDSPTSILMFLFHHHLRHAGLEPAEALRQAQLAMIEGAPPPPTMPEVLRSRLVDGQGSDILDWAGFFHSGR